jgi:hypothetical protein
VARGVITGSRVTSADSYRTMFYVGAIDERLNDKGYIVPGYVNHRLTSNDCASGSEILVTGCSALETRQERIMRIDRSIGLPGNRIDDLSQQKQSQGSHYLHLRCILPKLSVYFSKYKIHSADDSNDIREIMVASNHINRA